MCTESQRVQTESEQSADDSAPMFHLINHREKFLMSQKVKSETNRNLKKKLAKTCDLQITSKKPTKLLTQ
jgi:crotonobetainyl-CoA:carnitine CoA-transferase CaiB-like acyl-CoA transferase